MIMSRLVNKKANGKYQQAHSRNYQYGTYHSAFRFFPRADQAHTLALAGNADDNKKQSSYCRNNFTEDVLMHTGVFNNDMKLTKLSEP